MSFNGNQYEIYADKVITTKGDIVRGNSAGERERYGIGSANQVLQVSSGEPSWQTLSTAGSVLTTQGDVLYHNASGLARLGQSTDGHVLTTKGASADPVWAAVSGGANTALSNLSSAQLNEGIDINNKALDETGFLLFKMGGGTAISSGTLTIQQSFALVDTEGSASSDDLDDITQPASQIGEALLVLKCTHFGRNVVVKDGTGNLYLAGDFSLENVVDTLTLIGVSSGAGYYEISRSDNN
mgnify:CR=1 FL=1